MHHLFKIFLLQGIRISGNHKHHYLFNKEPLENWLDNTQNIIDINYATQQQKPNNIFFEKIDKTHGCMFAPSTLGLD